MNLLIRLLPRHRARHLAMVAMATEVTVASTTPHSSRGQGRRRLAA